MAAELTGSESDRSVADTRVGQMIEHTPGGGSVESI